jgi:tetratricopeptide (TPR) repeat protein
MCGIRQVLWFVAAALLLAQQVRAAGEGQADLDAATEARLTARSPADLERVVKLCEDALQKGLDDQNKTYATQLLTATLMERATQLTMPVFEQKPPDRRWPQFKQLALKDLEKAVSYDDQIGAAYMLMARLHALPGGDRDRALEAAGKAIELFADDNRERAQALALRGSLTQDEEQRTADFNAAIEADPDSVEALRLRGIFYITQKKFDEALRDLKQVIEKNPEDLTAMQAVAEVLASLKKYDEAEAQLNHIIELQPQSPGGYLLRARLNQLRENTEATLADLDKIVELDAGNVMARMMRARIYLEQRKTDEAKADVERVLERNSGVVEAILLRSMIFANEGNFAAAITDMKTIARAAPDNLPVKLQLAGLYAADEKPHKAIEIYNEVLAAEADNADALRGRGDAQLSLGNHVEAIADYEAALKLDPENRSLLNNFAWVLATSPTDGLRNAERAKQLAIKACELTEYKMPHILSTLAAAYAEAGDFETARKWSAKACELGEGEMKQQLGEELESYKQEKPWRELKQVKEEAEPAPPSEEDLFID